MGIEETHRLESADVKWAFREVYKNRYFTNHGPLAQKFELEAEALFSVKNAVATMNYTLAFLMAISGISKGGKVGILSGCPKEVFQAIAMTPVDFREVGPEELKEGRLLDYEILVINSEFLCKKYKDFFGSLIQKRVALIVACESISAGCKKTHVEDSVRVVKLGDSSLVQGGVIGTNDDDLSEKFRNIRSSYGIRKTEKVIATCNGRFSEVQSAIGLLLLRGESD
jgi:hypothetical protein